jgi:hypothetical protein
MDFEGALTFFETKARDYVLHVLGFLTSTAPKAADPAASPDDGPLNQDALAFGLISLAIGVTLQGVFIDHQKLEGIPFVARFITEGCFWLFLSVLAHLVLNVGRHVAPYSLTMVAAITVLPTAFMVGAYATFVAANFANFLKWNAPDFPGLVDIAVQMVVIIRYYPRSLQTPVPISHARIVLATIMLVFFVTVADLLTVYELNAPQLAQLFGYLTHGK